MFELKAIQAEEGDALLISYGKKRIRHILVDGGPVGTLPNLLRVLETSRQDGCLCLEALVVTHYDCDHIDGVIDLLRAKPDWLHIRDIWFNGYQHMAPSDVLGSAEGDSLVELIAHNYHWNRRFGGKAVKAGRPEPLALPGGLKVWVLSPDHGRLTALAAEWPSGKVVPESAAAAPPGDLLGHKDQWPPLDFADLYGAPRTKDRSTPNGSSIALLLEFEGKRMLLTGDAYADVIGDAIDACWTSLPPVHLLKVSHHGSKGNTSEKLLQKLGCGRFLISTSGKEHGHPDHVLVARLVGSTHNPELIFNYDCQRMANWATRPAGWPPFRASFPVPGDCFVRVVL